MKKTILTLALALLVTILVIPFTGCSGEDGATGAIGMTGATGAAGAQGATGATGAKGDIGATGKDGISVTSATVNSSGHLIITLSNGQSIDAGNVKGAAGTPGYGMQGATGEKGEKGDTGAQGPQGEPGADAPLLFDYTSMLILENKDTNWICIDDARVGFLLYNRSGEEFEFAFIGLGLEGDTEYSLIYYADEEDRYVNWGGNNPGALIAFGTTDGDGLLGLSGSVELYTDLPNPDDANMVYYNYNGSPDYYATTHGAKIWLVPSNCYAEPEVISWTPTEFLFETDLIWYEDTND